MKNLIPNILMPKSIFLSHFFKYSNAFMRLASTFFTLYIQQRFLFKISHSIFGIVDITANCLTSCYIV